MPVITASYTFGALMARPWQPGTFWKFHELRPHVGYDSYWNFDGLLESSRLHIDQHWQFRAGHEFHTGMNVTREGVTTPFEIYPGVIVPPAGTGSNVMTSPIAEMPGTLVRS